jgi:hypothetical protein
METRIAIFLGMLTGPGALFSVWGLPQLLQKGVNRMYLGIGGLLIVIILLILLLH